MQHKIVLGVPLAAMALCCSLLGQQDGVDRIPAASNESTDVEKAFKWFDTLGYPRLAGRKLVRVPGGWYSLSGDDPPKTYNAYAFLLREKGKRFTVFMLDLSEQTFEKTVDGTPEHYRVNFTVVDLETMATDHLESLRKLAVEESDPWRRFGAQLTERGELFVLARACHAAGHKQLAKDLITQALSIPDLQTGEPISIERLQVTIAEDFSHAEMWRDVVEFGDPEVSRKELLQRFLRITKHFPQSRHAQRAKNTAAILAKMVKEDQAHAEKKRKPLDEMTVEERVAELIFQLRDQNGQQWSQPGSCDIFLDPRDQGGLLEGLLEKSPRRDEGSPASQLVAIGEPALEQLIDSVDDDRFTRNVEFHRNFYFSHRVIRVGECCLTIINRINPGGRTFDIKGDPELAKRAMKAWYIDDIPKEPKHKKR